MDSSARPDAGAANELEAVAAVIRAREAAWNAGDAEAYGNLLDEDVDIVSATGRPAQGREALLSLYAEQRAGAYAGARTRTSVRSVRMLEASVALVDAEYELEGGAAGAARHGLISFVLRKSDGRWRICAIRGMPGR